MPRIHDQLVAVADEISPKLAAAIRATGPLRLVRRQREPLGDRLCRAVAGQQLSVAAAGSIWRQVLAQADGRPLMSFLRAATAEDLRLCGLSNAKVRAMQGIAAAEAAGILDPSALAALDREARTLRLTALWGVGAWTADMVGIFYFGDPDIWPDGDVTARKTLVRLTTARRKTVRTAARFAPFRSYLALHMWRWSDAAPG